MKKLFMYSILLVTLLSNLSYAPKKQFTTTTSHYCDSKPIKTNN